MYMVSNQLEIYIYCYGTALVWHICNLCVGHLDSLRCCLGNKYRPLQWPCAWWIVDQGAYECSSFTCFDVFIGDADALLLLRMMSSFFLFYFPTNICSHVSFLEMSTIKLKVPQFVVHYFSSIWPTLLAAAADMLQHQAVFSSVAASMWCSFCRDITSKAFATMRMTCVFLSGNPHLSSAHRVSVH